MIIITLRSNISYIHIHIYTHTHTQIADPCGIQHTFGNYMRRSAKRFNRWNVLSLLSRDYMYVRLS